MVEGKKEKLLVVDLNPPTNVIIYLQLIKKIVYIERGNRSNCATAYMKRP